MQLVVAMVAQRYQLDLLPGFPVSPQPAISLRPRHGLMMTLKSRARPSPAGDAARNGAAARQASAT